MPFVLLQLIIIIIIGFSIRFAQCHLSHTSVHNQFELNPANIDLLFRRTALMALLRAKANAIMDTVPLVERVVFRQCVTESKTTSPVMLAKCLTRLIQSRDQLQRRNKWAETDESPPIAANEMKKQIVISQNSINKKRKLVHIRHFFDLWRRREGRRNWIMGNKMQKSSRRKRALASIEPLPGRIDKTTGGRPNGKLESRAALTSARRTSNTWSSLLLNDSLLNLHELQRYMDIFDKARRSIARINAHNTELIARFNPFVSVRSAMPDGPADLLDLQHQITRFFDSLGINRISVLSPRFFSLFLSPQRRHRPHLLSPDLFAFHNSNASSSLSIADILSYAHLGDRESAAWLDLLLNMTGSAKIMERLIVKLKPEVQRLEKDVLPIIDQMELAEERWQRLRASLSERQQQMIASRGYVPLAMDQRNMLFPNVRGGCNSKFASSEETERELEQYIAELASMDAHGTMEYNKLDMLSQGGAEHYAFRQEKRRKKRQDVGGLAPTEEEGRQIPRTVVLEPFAFDSRVGGVVLEGIYLSPTAFYQEMVSPEVLTIRALSPIAFYTTILSPAVAFARVLSPEAFRAQILTPHALDAFILSPEAFMAEVLSPFVAEVRVLAPRTMFVQILGPSAGALHIGSADTHAIFVLSPRFLSTHIYSEERYLIEILSPHFLGGEHWQQNTEEDTHEHLGGTIRFVKWPGHSPPEKELDKHEATDQQSGMHIN